MTDAPEQLFTGQGVEVLPPPDPPAVPSPPTPPAGAYQVDASTKGAQPEDTAAVRELVLVPQPRAATVVTDNFNRADGALGANWISPISANVNASGAMKVAGNQAGALPDDKHSFGVWALGTFTDDQYAQAKVVTIGAWVGVTVRTEPTDNRIYYGFVFTANDYRLYQYLAGVHTQLMAGSTLTWVANDILRVEISGSVHPFSMRMYRNGVLALSWTSPDSTYEKTGGRPGIGMYSPAGLNLRLDNWEGGNLGKLHVSDSFNRADGALGANWTHTVASQSTLKIVSNRAGVTAETNHCAAFWNAATFDDNQYAQFRWFNTASAYTGAILRANATLDRYYLVAVTSNFGLTLYARWDGAYVSLGTATPTFLNNDMIRAEVIGTTHPITINVYQNGKLIFTWTSPNSTNVKAGGSPGMGIFSPAGAGLVLDDWEGGNL